MKRKQRAKTPEQEVIDIDEIEGPTSRKSQERWKRFVKFVTSSGDICGRSIKKDKSSSTKSFHAHLDTFHRISDPSLAKKTKMKHMDISKWSKSGTLQPQEILSGSCPTPQQRRHDLAPNFTAFMAVTAHFIDENFQMKNLTLGVPQVEGVHNGQKFAQLFYDVLD
ncbi:hypothetical protein PGT21_000978 [Puccinia graminis f. sp. tritici]|uniref:BED-type domain-containing protein n=1 Tax=Puccinia graminis f. sp. tritici TaxID=56615 RepID=A0A5B0MHV3_PUCGR|nr:hypothetical protein PGT21_000978 [Puccinia graminis f. sp. tritici]